MKIIDRQDRDGNTVRYWVNEFGMQRLNERYPDGILHIDLLLNAHVVVNRARNEIIKSRWMLEDLVDQAMVLEDPNCVSVKNMMLMAQSAGIAVNSFVAQHRASFMETFEPAHAGEFVQDGIRVELSANLIHYQFSTSSTEVERYIDHHSFAEWAETVSTYQILTDLDHA